MIFCSRVGSLQLLIFQCRWYSCMRRWLAQLLWKSWLITSLTHTLLHHQADVQAMEFYLVEQVKYWICDGYMSSWSNGGTTCSPSCMLAVCPCFVHGGSCVCACVQPMSGLCVCVGGCVCVWSMYLCIITGYMYQPRPCARKLATDYQFGLLLCTSFSFSCVMTNFSKVFFRFDHIIVSIICVSGHVWVYRTHVHFQCIYCRK